MCGTLDAVLWFVANDWIEIHCKSARNLKLPARRNGPFIIIIKHCSLFPSRLTALQLHATESHFVGMVHEEYSITTVIICWFCEAWCAHPCWWDMALEKWPLLSLISDCSFTLCILSIHWSGVLAMLFGCYMAEAAQNCCCLSESSVYIIQPRTSLQCYLKPHT